MRAVDVTGQDQIQLAIKAKAGDQTAAARLLLANERFITKRARRFMRVALTRGCGDDFIEDLTQAGRMGMLRAVKSFEPERGWKFLTYASTWIDQGIRRLIQQDATEIRIPVWRQEQRKSRGATDIAMVSLNAPAYKGDTEGVDRIDALATTTDGPDELLSAAHERASAQRTVARLMQGLTVDERTIIELRYLAAAPLTLEMVGRRLGCTRERVRQIETKTLQKIRANAGVTTTSAEFQAAWRALASADRATLQEAHGTAVALATRPCAGTCGGSIKSTSRYPLCVTCRRLNGTVGLSMTLVLIRQVLLAHPEGLSPSALHRQVQTLQPSITRGAIASTVHTAARRQQLRRSDARDEQGYVYFWSADAGAAQVEVTAAAALACGDAAERRSLLLPAPPISAPPARMTAADAIVAAQPPRPRSVTAVVQQVLAEHPDGLRLRALAQAVQALRAGTMGGQVSTALHTLYTRGTVRMEGAKPTLYRLVPAGTVEAAPMPPEPQLIRAADQITAQGFASRNGTPFERIQVSRMVAPSHETAPMPEAPIPVPVQPASAQPAGAPEASEVDLLTEYQLTEEDLLDTRIRRYAAIERQLRGADDESMVPRWAVCVRWCREHPKEVFALRAVANAVAALEAGGAQAAGQNRAAILGKPEYFDFPANDPLHFRLCDGFAAILAASRRVPDANEPTQPDESAIETGITRQEQPESVRPPARRDLDAWLNDGQKIREELRMQLREVEETRTRLTAQIRRLDLLLEDSAH